LTEKLKREWKDFVNGIGPFPGNYDGRGIVTCAGGIKYFTCAWVSISLLRKHGCKLPIEVWYAKDELSPDVIQALNGLGVSCKNVNDYTDRNIARFALKPFAILHSDFREVLFLDADNNATGDPTFLFESKEYQNCGALFWPDFWKTDRKNPIWKIVGSDAYQEVEQESGQILINKERCWRELNLCLYFNLNDWYGKMLYGDKDTFKFSWIALGSKYFMIGTPVGFCGFSDSVNKIYSGGISMVQHDLDGNILFVHRNLFKWDITYDDEVAWRKAKRFKVGAKERIFHFIPLHVWERSPFYVFDIEGDIDIIDFKDLFGDFEMDCLQILKDLRCSEFYKNFLLYSYFVESSPGFLSRLRGKVLFHLITPALIASLLKYLVYSLAPYSFKWIPSSVL
jgi:alpha 1,2-mannosyltransferase